MIEPQPIRTEEEYQEAVKEIDRLIDHPFPLPEDTARLVALGELVRAWEDEHVPEERTDDAD